MYVRAILMALPLAIGTACSTTQSRSNPSAHTATASSGQTEGNVTTSEPKTAAEPNTSPTSPSDQTASSSAGQTEGNVTTSEPKTATESDTSPSTSPSASASSSPSGSDVTRDPIMEPGDEVQAHAGDDVVNGTIARVSRRTLVIDSDTGEQKTLFLAPETSIQVDGQDARRSDLQEGQDVRASFNEVNGRDIAVKVRVGEEAASTTELGGSSAEPDSGSSGSSWDRGPGGTGAPSEPGNTSSDTSSDTSSSSGTK
jgi:hypothetical protein